MTLVHKYTFFFLFIALGSIFGLSGRWQSREKYDVNKTSPNGIYRVKVELREEKGNGTRDYTERLKVYSLKDRKSFMLMNQRIRTKMSLLYVIACKSLIGLMTMCYA